MPIFEYKCEDCGNKFEKLVRRPGAEEILCPSCGQSHLEQQYSAFAALAHGSPKDVAIPSCPSGMCQTPGFCGRNN